jgi:hypothetical protein
MNVAKKITRAGAGRTKGSYSFVKITLKELVAKFADQSTHIVVSRKFAEAVGFDNCTSAPASTITNSIMGETPESAAKVTVVEL